MNMQYIGYSQASEDTDVAQERARLWSVPREQLADTDTVLMFELCKNYGSFKAVDRVCHLIVSDETTKPIIKFN